MMEKIYTVPQVAEYLQISRSKMYDWVKKGKIPHEGMSSHISQGISRALKWVESQLTYASPDGQFVMFSLRD